MLTAAVVAAILGLPLGVDDGQTVTMKPVASGMMSKIGYYAPQRCTLSDKKPGTLTKEPAGLKNPSYGVLGTRGAEGQVFHVVLDEPQSGPPKLYIDADGDGDMTNDAPAEWTAKESRPKDGDATTMYNGGATLKIGGEKPYDAHISIYKFDRNDPQRAALKDVILYYRDYGAEGDVEIGGKTYHAALSDENASGDYRGKPVDPENERSGSGVRFFIDLNGNGKFDQKGESFDARKPFNIKGTTYEIADMRPDGSSFRIVKSEKTVPEIALAPDHSVGKKITPFEAEMMDGKTVKFPSDYKGKVVMIDFWATWCQPCMMEVPNVVRAYEKLHGEGFEILGVSLDQKNAAEKIKTVTEDKKMAWPQVYDGGFWKSRIPDMYAVSSIPAAYLVDGDTGEILADSRTLRGEQLEKTVRGALDKKSKK